jgi:hypothetical protein
MIRFFGWAVLAVALVMGTGVSRADTIVYFGFLNGPSESPPNSSPGTGLAEVDYNNVAHTLHVHVTFANLQGTTTASHIHSATAQPLTGTAGVATTTPTFANFPLGVTSGTYDNTLDLTQSSSYNPSFVTANGGTTASAEAALAAGLAAEKSYLNIHTSVQPGGEIRGFLIPQAALPEPASLTLAGIGALGLLGYGWKKRRTA